MLSANTPAVIASAKHTWRVHKPSSTRGRHGKLDPNRRLKARAVRKLRACLRCSALRIPCSEDDICIPCRKLVETARHVHVKRTLSFCACIRTRVVEVNLFEDVIPPPHAMGLVRENTEKLALRSISLSFSSLITWDLSNVALEFVESLNQPQLPTASYVGFMSSPEFLKLLEPHVGVEIAISFQRMVCAECLAYTQPVSGEKQHLGVSELQQIGAVAGYHVLNFLDRKVRPEFLRASSKATLEAVFLMLVGTILAIGYSRPNKNVENIVGDHTRFQAMQKYLCQILAHYLVYIGSKLHLLIDHGTEKLILEGAPKRWHKRGVFRWLTASHQEEKLHVFHLNSCGSACSHGVSSSDSLERFLLDKLRDSSNLDFESLSETGEANFSSLTNMTKLSALVGRLNNSMLVSTPSHPTGLPLKDYLPEIESQRSNPTRPSSISYPKDIHSSVMKTGELLSLRPPLSRREPSHRWDGALWYTSHGWQLHACAFHVISSSYGEMIVEEVDRCDAFVKRPETRQSLLV